MTRNTVGEVAYKNGFEAGKQAAVANLRKLKELPEEMRVRAISAVNAEQTAEFAPVVYAQWNDANSKLFKPHCSHCLMDSPKIGYTPKYCPNCGAKMDGDTVSKE